MRGCETVFVKTFSRPRIGANREKSNLTVLIITLIRVGIHRARSLPKTLAIAFAGVDRFEFRLLSGRHEMRVSFQILDDFFGDNFTFETPQSVFD